MFIQNFGHSYVVWKGFWGIHPCNFSKKLVSSSSRPKSGKISAAVPYKLFWKDIPARKVRSTRNSNIARLLGCSSIVGQLDLDLSPNFPPIVLISLSFLINHSNIVMYAFIFLSLYLSITHASPSMPFYYLSFFFVNSLMHCHEYPPISLNLCH